MNLICTGCFANPVAADRSAENDFVELLVCNLGGVALPQGIATHDALRCDYCGSTVHLDHRHLAWYDR